MIIKHSIGRLSWRPLFVSANFPTTFSLGFLVALPLFLAGRQRQENRPNRLVADLFSNHVGRQQSREGGSEAIIDQAKHVTEST
jgi:hypothetical protein